MERERLTPGEDGGEDPVERIKWMLNGTRRMEAGQPDEAGPRTPPSPDSTSPCGSRLILDSVGPSLLADLVGGTLDLLGSSCTVFESSGDPALSILSSGWCRFMDRAFRRRCDTTDDREAGQSGSRQCHESCWKAAALRFMKSNEPVDELCRGGIRLFTVPILAGRAVVGGISVGYGDPPRDPERLTELALLHGLHVDDLRRHAEAYDTRPVFIIETAKRQILSAARVIGEIVERRQAEGALRKSEAKFRALFDFAKDAIFILDPEGRILEANREACERLGYSHDEFLKMSAMDVDSSDHAELVPERIEKLLRQGHHLFESVHRRRDGTLLPVEISARMFESEGKPLIFAVCRDITERKKAESALAESEKRFSVFMEYFPAGVFIKDQAGRMLFANRYLKELFDWKDCVGKTTEELLPLEVARRMTADDRKALTEGPRVIHERVMDQHGVERFFDTFKFPIEVEGSPALLGGVAVDVSERKRSEEALEKRIVALTRPLDDDESISFEDLFSLSDLQRLQDLFAKVWGVAALITSPDGTPITQPSNFTHFCSEFIRKNEKGSRNCRKSDAMLGRHNPSGPIIQACLSAGLWGAGASITVGGRHIASWLIGQVRNDAQTEEQIMEYAREIGADEAAFREAFLQVPVMPQKTFEQVAHSLFALANQLSVMAYQNIQQARFIAERKRAEEALQESEERYSAVVQHAKDGVIIIQDDHVRFANRSLEEALGYAHGEMENTPLLNHVAPEHRALIAERVKARLEGKEVPQIYEARLMRRDGTVMEVELSASIIQYRGKAADVCILRDITDRRRMEEERRKFEVQMREVQKLESLGILAGGIAHDFNNLLTAILGNADLAQLSLSPVSPARRYIEEIMRVSHRAADLCGQMLAYSGKGRFVVSRYDISEIVREMGQMLDVTISKKAMMRYALTEGLPAVEADATQMRQVIMNLITNASEALGDKKGVITVATGVMECDEAYLSESYLDDHLPGGAYVYLEVSDTGCGMDNEARRRIFDPFFTTKFTGRGLGLAAVLGIVRGHKGAIKVYSEMDKGTTFRVLLPAMEWEPGDRVRTLDETAPLKGAGTVLLVDDEPFVRNVASAMLIQLGFQVLTAGNGREGVEVFRTHGAEITCVILDLMMPEMGGEETFRELRKLRGDIPVILSSGYNEQDVTQRFVGRGLSGFIQKPYTVASLRSVLKQVLG